MRAWQKVGPNCWSPPGENNACGLFAFSALLGAPTIDPQIAWVVINAALRQAGHATIHEYVHVGYKGLPFDIAQEWATAIGVLAFVQDDRKKMIDAKGPGGIYLVVSKNPELIGHYYVRLTDPIDPNLVGTDSYVNNVSDSYLLRDYPPTCPLADGVGEKTTPAALEAIIRRDELLSDFHLGGTRPLLMG